MVKKNQHGQKEPHQIVRFARLRAANVKVVGYPLTLSQDTAIGQQDSEAGLAVSGNGTGDFWGGDVRSQTL